MADLASFIVASFVAGLSATIPPGTIFTMTVAESAERGPKAGLMVVIGHALVEVIVVFMLTMGLGLLLSSEVSKIIVGFTGGMVLIWTGCNLVKGIYENGVKLPEKEGYDIHNNTRTPLFKGVLASVANPYFIVWWATVGGSFIVSGSSLLGWLSPFVFLLCHWMSDFPWFAFISYSVYKGRGFLGDKGYKALLGVCGVSLVALGIIYIKEGLILALNT
jgi:threonine/homoserine/homoserine lactone efflux protein